MITRRLLLPILAAAIALPALAELPAGAMRAMRLKQWRQAVIELRQAREDDPTDPEIASRLGTAYVQMGYYADALSPFEDAAGSTYYANNGLGAHAGALRELGRYDEALALRQAMLLGAEGEGKQLVVLLALSDDLAAMGDIDGAVDAAWEALAIRPDGPMSHAWLADLHAQRGESDEALFHAWLADHYGQAMSRSWTARARIALDDDAPIEALDAMMAAREGRRRNAEFAILHAQVYERLGWLEDARWLLELKQPLYGDRHDWLLGYGRVLHALGERREACELLTRAQRLYPHHHQAQATAARLGCRSSTP